MSGTLLHLQAHFAAWRSKENVAAYMQPLNYATQVSLLDSARDPIDEPASPFCHLFVFYMYQSRQVIGARRSSPEHITDYYRQTGLKDNYDDRVTLWPPNAASNRSMNATTAVSSTVHQIWLVDDTPIDGPPRRCALLRTWSAAA